MSKGRPVRRTARVVLLDENGQVLLVRFVYRGG